MTTTLTVNGMRFHIDNDSVWGNNLSMCEEAAKLIPTPMKTKLMKAIQKAYDDNQDITITTSGKSTLDIRPTPHA